MYCYKNPPLYIICLDKKTARLGTVNNIDVVKDFVNSRIKATLFGFLKDIVKSLRFDSSLALNLLI